MSIDKDGEIERLKAESEHAKWLYNMELSSTVRLRARVEELEAAKQQLAGSYNSPMKEVDGLKEQLDELRTDNNRLCALLEKSECANQELESIRRQLAEANKKLAFWKDQYSMVDKANTDLRTALQTPSAPTVDDAIKTILAAGFKVTVEVKSVGE